ncbi:uncharacterized protein LOC111643482 [Copidosoma floridanum]|uniref:uncharacterized protein LOC111643482 n=1 Tax=Copidosoma floridanum TaxID=29053 RepID=UPI000C6FB608|nr:uncharacterized protein LOC111643482 [Copidosoma floridanum]
MSEVITISSSDDEVVLPKASQRRTHDNTSSKLQKKYNKLDSFNKDDKDFILFLRNRVNNITHKKAKFYQTIFEVREEISRRIIKLKKYKSTREKGSESDTEPKYTKDELKKIKILEKVIKECRRRIKELETADVIFDDDDDSAYLKEDRYKRKYVQLCQALSDIARDKKLKSEIMKKKITLNDIQDEMTGIKTIDQSIINFVNISISRMNKLKHIQNFNAVPNYIVPPDFYEVLQIIEKHDETRNLQFTKQEIELYAKNSFKAVVKYLKKCRIQESKEYFKCFINDTCGTYIDPASKDHNLEKVLQANKLKSDKHLNEVFEKYVNMQKNLSNEKLKESMTAMYSSEESCNIDNHEKHLVKKNSQVGKRKRFFHSDEEESDSPTLVDDNAKYFPRIRVASVGNFPKAWETSDSPESPGKESMDLDYSPKKNIFPPVEVVDLCSPERRSSIQVSKTIALEENMNHNEVVE